MQISIFPSKTIISHKVSYTSFCEPTINAYICYLSTGVFSLYPCDATAVQDGRMNIATEFIVQAYSRDKIYKPIVMYFYKFCDKTAPQGT